MKSGLVCFFSCLLLLGCAPSEPAQEANPYRQEASGDWQILFDGSSFDAWRGYKQEQMPEAWGIVDGIMTIDGTTGYGDIITREQFADFELEFEWRVPEAGNSGVMYRVLETDGPSYATGPEYQILDDGYHHSGGTARTSAASCYDMYEPSAAMTKPAGEWNTAKIVVDGAHVEHWLNGEKLVEYAFWTDQWKADVQGSKWKDFPEYGLSETGHIALQGDHSPVSYRNIRIRRL